MLTRSQLKTRKRLRRLRVVQKYFIFGFSKAFNITAAKTDSFGEYIFPTIVVEPDSHGTHLPLTAIFAEKGPSEPEIVPC